MGNDVAKMVLDRRLARPSATDVLAMDGVSVVRHSPKESDNSQPKLRLTRRSGVSKWLAIVKA